jgi:UDP-N-acetyl-D-glucosamine dehydrogenase
LRWKLRTLNYTARFIELADEINGHMPDYVTTKVVNALNDESKAVRGSRILVLGVAYKPNVSDVRESPALDVIQLLQTRGALVDYHDPHVPSLSLEDSVERSVPLTDTLLREADCVVIITHHDAIDWSKIANTARLIVDTRHAIDQSGCGRIIYL